MLSFIRRKTNIRFNLIQIYFNPQTGVTGTYWATSSDSGGCQLPAGNYAITNALALGQETALGDLAWVPSLCGQVLNVNCGHSTVQAVVASTCNLGSTSCGTDMIAKTYNLATNNASPGEVKCTVTLSTTNPLSASGPQCYYRPTSPTGNEYYANLGVFNTSGKQVVSAAINNIVGKVDSGDGYYTFNSDGKTLFTSNVPVTFTYNDGSTSKFTLSQCQNAGNVQIFE